LDLHTRSRLALVTAVAAVLGAPALASATDIHGVKEVAAELPQVFVLLRRPALDNLGQPIPPDEVTPLGNDGEFAAIAAYLDTGASGILISSGTAHPTFGVDVHNETIGGEPVKFLDVGTTETGAFHVSELLDFEIAAYPGPPVDLSFDDMPAINDTFEYLGRLRTQLSPQPDSIDDLTTTDLVGMPAMVGKVTVLDARRYNRPFDLEDPDSPFPVIRTHIFQPGTPYNPAADDYAAEVVPGIPTTDRTVRLTFESFDQYSSVIPDSPTTPRPITAHNPFIGASPLNPNDPNAPPGVTLSRDAGPNGPPVEGNFLLDTGAQLSFMSSDKAAQLGITGINPATGEEEFNDDGFQILYDIATGQPVPIIGASIQGASGDAVPVSGFQIDSISIPTAEGDPLVFHDAWFLLIDVVLDDGTNPPVTLDGAVGSNLLLPSFELATFDLVGGAFDWVVFDEPNGELRFAFAPYVPEPGTFGVAVFAAAGALLGRRRRVAA
jgi:hypothetical protein